VIYEVSEGKAAAVRIELKEISDGQYRVAIGGEEFGVDAVKSGPTIYSIIENGRQYEASVDEQGAHGFDVLIKGHLFHLKAVDERSKLLAEQAAVAASGPQTIQADMPGKVVKVSAAVGDEVREGQGIVVVEAMKMENEIFSPIAGRIKELPASEGQTVETGATLFVVEPLENSA